MKNHTKVLTTKDIIKLIPHRDPFLLVDELRAIVKNESIIGIKNVSQNEKFFDGHFPVYPVMPGVLIIEAMAQTAACLVSYSNKDLQNKKVVFLTGIEEAKFKKPVLPGCELLLKIHIINKRKNFFKFTGKAYVNEDLMALSNFSAMISI